MSDIFSIFTYLAVFSLSAFLISYGYRNKKIVPQILGLALPILMAAIRYKVGLDFSSYLQAYADVAEPEQTYRYGGTPGLEPSFHIIAWVSYYVFSSPIFMFFVYAFVTITAFYKTMLLAKIKHIGIGFFLFLSIYFLNSFTIMRQGAAISIGCLAIVYFSRGHKLRAVLMGIVATIFHISGALALLYMLAVWLLEFTSKTVAWFKLDRLLIPAASIAGLLVLAGLFSSDFSYFIYNITGRIGAYGGVVSLGFIFKYMLLMLSVFVLYRKWGELDSFGRRMILFGVIGLIVYSLGFLHNESARIGAYLATLVPLYFCMIHDKMDVRHAVKIRSLGLLFGITYLVAVHFGNSGVTYEYRSIFNSVEYSNELRSLGV